MQHDPLFTATADQKNMNLDILSSVKGRLVGSSLSHLFAHTYAYIYIYLIMKLYMQFSAQTQDYMFIYCGLISIHGTAFKMLRSPWSTATQRASMHLQQSYLKMKPKSYWVCEHIFLIYVPQLLLFSLKLYIYIN